MRNAGLEEAQAGIKIAGRNIKHLRYADDTTLMAKSEEELKSLLMKVKEGSGKAGLKLKILQARLQQDVNRELQMFKLVLEKAEETEIKLPTSAGSWRKQESSRKTSISALLIMPKPFTVWITINCGKF